MFWFCPDSRTLLAPSSFPSVGQVHAPALVAVSVSCLFLSVKVELVSGHTKHLTRRQYLQGSATTGNV